MIESIFGKAPNYPWYFNYEEHDGQKEVMEALRKEFLRSNTEQASVIEIIAGRGWGKTLFFVCTILIPFLGRNPNSKVMWVAPTQSIGMTPIDDVFNGYDENTGKRYVEQFDSEGNKIWHFSTTKSGPMIQWFNGATVLFRSAAAPDSIVSKGYNMIIIDEAAVIPESVFNLQIVGTARKKDCKIFLITTPRGKKHWTHQIFRKGQTREDKSFLSFQQPYWKNPKYSPMLAKLMKTLPEWLQRQEYGAEFVDDGDTIFKNLNSIWFGEPLDFPHPEQEWSVDPIADHSYSVGMDIAKSQDYTVITVLDQTDGKLVYYRRFNKKDYRTVLDIAAAVCKRYNGADLVFDATGVGAGLSDMLNNYDIVTIPYVFTNESKNELVNTLALSVEYKEISLPHIKEIEHEMAVFTYEITRTGKISYNAPSGHHDDIVMSLALANWHRKDAGGLTNVGVIDAIIEHNMAGMQRRRSIYDDMRDDND